MNLLLLSNSANAGHGYLDHAWDEVMRALDGVTELLFIPYALADRDGYTARAADAFSRHGVHVTGIHRCADPRNAIATADAVFVGGGNTFRLLKTVKTLDLVAALRAHAAADRLYMGASAGTNIAAPTIRTTNDMPIVDPEGFEALGLVPFQINCHYIDPDPDSTFAGETRQLRLLQYLEENHRPVVALREGTWLRVRGSDVVLGGHATDARAKPARCFARQGAPADMDAGPLSVAHRR